MNSAQLRAARGMVGWTRKRLAEKVGVAEKTLQLFEAGERVPQHATVEAIQGALENEGVIFLQAEGASGVLMRD